jgi:ABC-type microcin C transport system permease subunit YejE
LVLTVKEQEFIEAARSCGASDKRLIFRHILPNCIAPVIVEATMGLAGAILSAAGLSFIMGRDALRRPPVYVCGLLAYDAVPGFDGGSFDILA